MRKTKSITEVTPTNAIPLSAAQSFTVQRDVWSRRITAIIAPSHTITDRLSEKLVSLMSQTFTHKVHVKVWLARLRS